jgi:hypothetical protein
MSRFRKLFWQRELDEFFIANRNGVTPPIPISFRVDLIPRAASVQSRSADLTDPRE